MKEKALNEFLDKLKSKFSNKIYKVILFGSYARGDYDEESDIDILIVGDIELDDIIDLIFEILIKYGILINAVVESTSEFEKWKDTSFHQNVLNEGISLI